MIEKILLKLDAERNQAAIDLALRKPADVSEAYHLGKGQGYYAGLNKALMIVSDLLKDKEDRDNDL